MVSWLVWWIASVRADQLVHGQSTWVPVWNTLGIDFQYNYLAVRHWLAGGNPYRQLFGDARGLYTYPPMVLLCFVWCGAMNETAATVVWLMASSGMLAFLGWKLAKSRGFPPLLAIGLMLYSTPVLFALERGNCDVIVLVLIFLAAMAMKRRSLLGDFFAGGFLAMGMWVKIYPGLAVLGLIPLRRWRVFISAVGMGLFIAIIPLSATRDFFHNEQYRSKFIVSAATLQNDPGRAESGVLYYPPLEAFSHSLPIYWRTFWEDVPGVRRIPGMIGAGLVLGPMIGWVAWKVFKSAGRNAVVLPFLVWLAMVGTFWMPVSYDYNLIYLPVLILMLLYRRDGWVAWVMMAPVVVYLQPIGVGIPMAWLLLFKLLCIPGLGICVSHRAGEAATRGDGN